MRSPEITLFLAVNADASTPGIVVELARFASTWLPALSLGALLLWAGVGGRSAWAAAGRALLALGLAWCLARLLREGLQLPRPVALGLGRQWIDHGGGPGLPSLHATGAFAFAFALRDACGRGTVAALAFAAALLVAWSRLSLGVHFPSDILAGAVVGAFAARVAGWTWNAVDRTLRRWVPRFRPPVLPAGR